MQRILALDVSFVNTGWAVIEPYTDKDMIVAVGNINNPSDPKKKKRVRASNLLVERIQKVYRELCEVYELYDPSAVIAEIPVAGGKSMKAAQGMTAGTAIAALFVVNYNLATEWTQPDEGKMAMCRTKAANKMQMQAAAIDKFPELRNLVPESPRSKTGYEGWFEHAADAIAAFLAAKHGTLVKMCATNNGIHPDVTLF